jgi:vitamin B12 transporter
VRATLGGARRIERRELAAVLAAAIWLQPAAPAAQPGQVVGSGAAGAPDTLVVPLPEVVVSALRGQERLRDLPAAAFVIPRAELAQAAAPRISTLLQAIPGLYGYHSGATGDPGVVDPRGFTANGESSYLKVLLNGRDTRDLENGDVDWDWLGPESAERVEVVEGPGAWLYGDGAAGGIVNIVRDEWRAGLHPRATVRLGSFEQRGGRLGASWGTPPAAMSLAGGGRDADGWRDRSRERVRAAHATAGWRPALGTSLALDASWLDARRQDPGALTPQQMAADRTQAENPGDFTDAERLLAGLTLRHGEFSRQQWTLAPYVRLEEQDQVRTLLFTPLLHPTSGTTVGLDLGWQATLSAAGPLLLSAGYQLEGSRLRTRYYDGSAGARGGLLASGRAERRTQSAFAGARWNATESVVARLGLRYDAIRVEFEDRQSGATEGPRTLSALSPFVAVSARHRNTIFYGSWSGAFHAPTLNQLYDRRPFPTFMPPPAPPFVTISNGDLDPQRSLGYELGARWGDGAGRFASIGFYDVFVRNEIDFDLGTFAYANIGRSRHSGALLAAWLPLPARVALLASGTLSPTTIRGGAQDGNQINAVPLGTAYGRLDWSATSWAALEAGLRWVARQYLDKDNRHPLGEFTTVEVGGSLRLGRARASIRVANLLDRHFADTGFIGALGEERLMPAARRHVVVALSAE